MSEMVEVKVVEIEGAALDYTTAKTQRIEHDMAMKLVMDGYDPSINWSLTGLLIEQERISLSGPGCMGGVKEQLWSAFIDTGSFAGSRSYSGPTPLIAACRCLVGLELGETVQVPKELVECKSHA